MPYKSYADEMNLRVWTEDPYREEIDRLLATKPITEAALARLDALDLRYEAIDGEYVLTAPQTDNHSFIASRFLMQLFAFTEAQELGDVYAHVGFVLRGTPEAIATMYMPDIAFVPTEGVIDPQAWGFYYKAPDFVIEVVMPNEKVGYVRRKVRDLLDRGCQELWLVHMDTEQVDVCTPDKRLVAYELGDTITMETILPGFSVRVQDIFAWD